MNPTLKKILHWGLILILLFASVFCLYLGLFAIHGDTAEAHTNRFMSVITGMCFAGITAYFVRYTLKNG
jgi:uncharacterized PurR-regulated membrane protein YhhQ (DUF165 family)